LIKLTDKLARQHHKTKAEHEQHGVGTPCVVLPPCISGDVMLAVYRAAFEDTPRCADRSSTAAKQTETYVIQQFGRNDLEHCIVLHVIPERQLHEFDVRYPNGGDDEKSALRVYVL
jgi:hypothetical protein